MDRDLRGTELYREIEALCARLRRPGSGQISDAVEAHVSPQGTRVAFAGTIVDTLDGLPPTRICLTDLATGDTRVLTFGPNTDRSPKFSPEGHKIAFLSDRHKAGDFQLYLLNPTSGAARATPAVDGWVEYFHWSPDGQRILLGVAGHGADVAGGQGAVTSNQAATAAPSWMPAVDSGDETYRWRRVWLYELATHCVRQVSAPNLNIWEATWCGNDGLVAVVSPGPGEGLWYTATLHLIHIDNGKNRELYKPIDQLGWPAASPSGTHVAVVESICSDRWIVAGELRLIDITSGKVQKIDTRGIDISCTEWRSDRRLLVGGHRGFETVVGLYDLSTDNFTERWSSQEITMGGRYITLSGFNESGDCVLIGESYLRAPELAVIRGGKYCSVRSFDLGYDECIKSIGAIEQVCWNAMDGLEIQGWLVRPSGTAPYPLIMNIHGGPVWHSRPVWLGRWNAPLLTLVKRGYAIFFPNPRGSSGRGREFIRHVYGDMGGADAQDLLSGLDALAQRGTIDPQRIGLTGGSYGGFMTAWLITQDPRFSAAVAVAPHTNQVTERLISNIPHFMDLILQDKYNNPGGLYFQRSPIMHTHNVKTPTLSICGALDRCTPPEEAVQFHNALLEQGVTSVLITYPEEGHGVRRFPTTIDYATRLVNWFESHMRVPAHEAR